MRHVETDLFHVDCRDFLVMVDRLSGYLCADELRSTNTAAVTKTLTKWFNILGWPETIRSDGGPQFLEEFDTSCKCHVVTHELSPIYSPQSNGLAEAAVKNTEQLRPFALEKHAENRRSQPSRTPLQQTTDHQHTHDITKDK